MCSCGNYCPHCGQLKVQPYYQYWHYQPFLYQQWQGGAGGNVPVTQTAACNTTMGVDVLGNKLV